MISKCEKCGSQLDVVTGACGKCNNPHIFNPINRNAADNSYFEGVNTPVAAEVSARYVRSTGGKPTWVRVAAIACAVVLVVTAVISVILLTKKDKPVYYSNQLWLVALGESMGVTLDEKMPESFDEYAQKLAQKLAMEKQIAITNDMKKPATVAFALDATAKALGGNDKNDIISDIQNDNSWWLENYPNLDMQKLCDAALDDAKLTPKLAGLILSYYNKAKDGAIPNNGGNSGDEGSKPSDNSGESSEPSDSSQPPEDNSGESSLPPEDTSQEQPDQNESSQEDSSTEDSSVGDETGAEESNVVDESSQEESSADESSTEDSSQEESSVDETSTEQSTEENKIKE